MFMKISYIALAAASLGLLLFEAPRGGVLTSSPTRGKVERQEAPSPRTASNSGSVRRAVPYFVLLGGYHGGK